MMWQRHPRLSSISALRHARVDAHSAAMEISIEYCGM